MLNATPDSLIELRAGADPADPRPHGPPQPHIAVRVEAPLTPANARKPSEDRHEHHRASHERPAGRPAVPPSVMGWRLNRRLKALRDSHEASPTPCATSNAAAARAEQGLADLRAATDEATDLLADRIEKGARPRSAGSSTPALDRRRPSNAAAAAAASARPRAPTPLGRTPPGARWPPPATPPAPERRSRAPAARPAAQRPAPASRRRRPVRRRPLSLTALGARR